VTGVPVRIRPRPPAVLRQRAKVNLVCDEELSKLLPVRVTVVEIELIEGVVKSNMLRNICGEYPCSCGEYAP
jgi:hypothetical protein